MTRKNLINLFSLGCIQLSNAILPLLVFPLLLKKLGAETFAKIVTTEVISFLVLTTVLYSFELEGVSKVADLSIQENSNKISEIFWNIFNARILLYLFCWIALLIFSFLFSKQIVILLFLWMLLPLSYIFYSHWLYQGLQNNSFIAVLSIVSKLLTVTLLLFLVNTDHDFYLVPLLIGGINLLAGIISFLYLHYKFNLFFFNVSIKDSLQLIFHGKEIFFGNIAIIFYRDLNTLILSLFGNSIAVSVYSVAEKIIKIFQAIARPLNQFFLPKLALSLSTMNEPNKKTYKLIFNYTFPQLLILSTLALIFFCGAGYCYMKFPELFHSVFNTEVLVLLMIMSISVLFGVSNYMLGMAGLNYLNRKFYFAKSTIITGLLSLLITFIFTFYFLEKGAAVSFIISEIILFGLISYPYIKVY